MLMTNPVDEGLTRDDIIDTWRRVGELRVDDFNQAVEQVGLDPVDLSGGISYRSEVQIEAGQCNAIFGFKDDDDLWQGIRREVF